MSTGHRLGRKWHPLTDTLTRIRINSYEDAAQNGVGGASKHAVGAHLDARPPMGTATPCLTERLSHL
jgi:hypothetical protein